MNKRYIRIIISLFVLLAKQLSFAQDIVSSDTILLADPTIIACKDALYLTGTSIDDQRNAFKLYTSVDGKNWKYKTVLIKRGEAYGTTGFWAPQIIKNRKWFYLFYTANEHIAVAKSRKLTGTYNQTVQLPLDSNRMIDPFVYIDRGKAYLYHVRLEQGNKIFVGELTDDFTSFKPGTVKECITANLPWENAENASWTVVEGPTVLKHNGWYYLIYSANDFRSSHYAVGYAISKSASGPWEKPEGNPIISKEKLGINGTGHGDVFRRNGKIYYVFHTHASDIAVAPRKTAIVEMEFHNNGNKPDRLEILANSFYYLTKIE